MADSGEMVIDDIGAITTTRHDDGRVTIDAFPPRAAFTLMLVDLADNKYLRVTVEVEADNGRATYEVTHAADGILYARLVKAEPK